MSKLTVYLRGHGLGPALDAVEAVEKEIGTALPADVAAKLKEALSQVRANAPVVGVTAIETLGSMVGKLVVGALSKQYPGLTHVADDVMAPIIREVESILVKYIQQSLATSS